MPAPPTTSPSSSSTSAVSIRSSRGTAHDRRLRVQPAGRRGARRHAPGAANWLHPNRQAANEPSHFEPAAEFLEELIEEDRRRAKRRRIGWIVGLVVVLALIGSLLLLGAYNWTQTRYFVGADDDTVVIFQGIQQDIGPISLSTPYEDTEHPARRSARPSAARPSSARSRPARSRDATAIVDRLRDASEATR